RGGGIEPFVGGDDGVADVLAGSHRIGRAARDADRHVGRLGARGLRGRQQQQWQNDQAGPPREAKSAHPRVIGRRCRARCVRGLAPPALILRNPAHASRPDDPTAPYRRAETVGRYLEATPGEFVRRGPTVYRYFVTIRDGTRTRYPSFLPLS